MPVTETDGKLTQAQKRALTYAARGERVVSAGQWEVHTSFTTGETWVGVPHGAYRTCERNGWIANERITEAGRAALSKSA